MTAIHLQKTELRRQMLQKRTEIPPEEKEKKSRAICEAILRSDLYIRAKALYAYMPFRGEADVLPVIADAWKRGKRVAVPRVLSETDMDFFIIRRFADCASGAYGILEPKTSCPPAREAHPFVLVPGTAFTREGYRMGYGKGYYDRYLASHAAAAAGVCYEEQLAESLPTEKTDQKLARLFFA